MVSLTKPISIENTVKDVILVEITMDTFGAVDLTEVKEQFSSLYYVMEDGTVERST